MYLHSRSRTARQVAAAVGHELKEADICAIVSAVHSALVWHHIAAVREGPVKEVKQDAALDVVNRAARPASTAICLLLLPTPGSAQAIIKHTHPRRSAGKPQGLTPSPTQRGQECSASGV